jgi:hypothetical protein
VANLKLSAHFKWLLLVDIPYCFLDRQAAGKLWQLGRLSICFLRGRLTVPYKPQESGLWPENYLLVLDC